MSNLTPYPFVAQIPVESAIKLGKLAISGELGLPDGLVLSGAISGELGEYLRGTSTTLAAGDSYKCGYDLQTCVDKLQEPSAQSFLTIGLILRIIALVQEMVK